MNKKFVKTKNVKAFISLVSNIKKAPKNVPRMGLIFGEPGLGKTETLVWLTLRHDVVLITAKNGMSTRWFLKDLVIELGEAPSWYCAELFEQAVRKLVEKPRMLIIDEVDYLVNSSKSIEIIRDLHDKTGVPVLLIGMGQVDKKLSRYKHLFDRILEIYRFEPFDFDDVKEIVKTLSEVDVTDEVIQVIHQKANRFRQIVKLISKLENFAKTNGCNQITKEVWESIK